MTVVSIAIHVKPMYDICADQLDGHGIARVDFQFGGRIGKLARINFKGTRLRRDRSGRNRREGDYHREKSQ